MNIGCVLAIVCSLMACEKTDNDRPQKKVIRPVKLVEVMPAEAGALRQFPATVESAKVTDLSFRIAGKLKELPIVNGQRVDTNELLALLDDEDVQEDVMSTKNEYEVARDNFERAQNMLKKNFISQVDFDASKNRKIASEAAWVKAKNRLKYTRLEAPFAGVISNVQVDNFQTVSPNQVIAKLQVSDLLELVFSVPEKILISLRESDESRRRSYRPTVTFSSLPGKTFSAQYKEHQARSNPGSQTYDVILVMPKPDDLIILPGMSATVQVDFSKLQSAQASTAWSVPFNALVQDDSAPLTQAGQAWVWRYDPETSQVEQVSVTVQRIENQSAAVTGDLKAGDQLVSAGLHLLNTGMTVKPLERQRGL